MTRETAKIKVEMLDNYLSHTCQDYGESDHEAMMMAIKALEQEPKTGYWKKIQKTQKGCHDCTVITYEYHCSECDRINVSPYKKFCPNCGARMKGRAEE